MSKIIEYEDIAVIAVERYIRQYREYFEGLYINTGLFGEEQIIDRYIQDSRDRKGEIFDLIEHRLSSDIILGRTPVNAIFLHWRLKTLWITWRDEGDTRIITDMTIR